MFYLPNLLTRRRFNRSVSRKTERETGPGRGGISDHRRGVASTIPMMTSQQGHRRAQDARSGRVHRHSLCTWGKGPGFPTMIAITTRKRKAGLRSRGLAAGAGLRSTLTCGPPHDALREVLLLFHFTGAGTDVRKTPGSCATHRGV